MEDFDADLAFQVLVQQKHHPFSPSCFDRKDQRELLCLVQTSLWKLIKPRTRSWKELDGET